MSSAAVVIGALRVKVSCKHISIYTCKISVGDHMVVVYNMLHGKMVMLRPDLGLCQGLFFFQIIYPH